MAARQFLVFEVPAEETKIGAITKGRPGCRVDLVGKPLIREEGHAYLLHYVVEGIDDDTRLAILRATAGVYEAMETLRWDPATGVWEARGVVPVDRIESRGLRFVAGLFGLAQAPWVVFEGGQARVRLFPREAQLMPKLAEAVDARLSTLGIPQRPRLEPLDLETYRRRAWTVGIHVGDADDDT